MKASELLNCITKLVEDHGDCDISIRDASIDFSEDAQNIYYEDDFLIFDSSSQTFWKPVKRIVISK
jgi:hypothetical protein